MDGMPRPDAEMRARIDALDPPVSAEEIGYGSLVEACARGDYPRAFRLLERGCWPGTNARGGALHAAVVDANHARLVELLVAAGADAQDDEYVLETPLHEVGSAAVARVLLRAAGGVVADANATPAHNCFASPAALRVLVEEGGVDPWARELEGHAPLHLHAGDVARAETLLALMLLHAGTGTGTLSAAANVPARRGGPPLAYAGGCPAAAAMLLACGADVRVCGLAAVARASWALRADALQVILAHAAATLPGAPRPGVLVQHARDSPHFTGRVAAWESRQRAGIDHQHATARGVLPYQLDDDQRAQRVLLLDEKRARNLADVEESLAAWAWARGVVAAAADVGASAVLRPPTFAEWLNARDDNDDEDDGGTALWRALGGGGEAGGDECALLLLRYGARIDSQHTFARLLQRGPAVLRAALTDCGGAAAAGVVVDRAACAGAEPALLAAFDECLKVRVKRISAGLKSAVPLPAHSTHYAPLDIVSAYLGFSLQV